MICSSINCHIFFRTPSFFPTKLPGFRPRPRLLIHPLDRFIEFLIAILTYFHLSSFHQILPFGCVIVRDRLTRRHFVFWVFELFIGRPVLDITRFEDWSLNSFFCNHSMFRLWPYFSFNPGRLVLFVTTVKCPLPPPHIFLV